jgi:hypothetical protein
LFDYPIEREYDYPIGRKHGWMIDWLIEKEFD